MQDDQYTGDGVSVTSTDGLVNMAAADLLRAETTSDFDNQGRVFATHVFDVNPTNGTVSTNSLTTNFYFDHRGDQVAERYVSIPASEKRPNWRS